jgi:hypothetical protein
MKRKSTIILILLLTFCLTGCGQTNISIPKKFVETTPPKVGSSKWLTLNHSKNEFGVKNKNGQLEIKKVKENNRCDFQLPQGTLTAIDNGEFGGDLTYYPSDETKKPVRIAGGNIKFIFDYKNKIYFIGGIAHGTYSGGALYELDTTAGQFKYQKKLDFEDAPEAFTIFDDKFLVATHENFYIIKKFQKELIFKDTFWSTLYPNSIAAFDDANIFIGMRGGIVKIDLTKKSFKFFKNSG